MWPERYCVNGGALFTALAALSMVTDILILALPLRYLLGILMLGILTRIALPVVLKLTCSQYFGYP
jgi:hypothetical protein